MHRHQGSSTNYFPDNGNYSQNNRKKNLKRTSRGMHRYNGQPSIVGSIPEPVASTWSECHDASSGHAYYWNISTNEVTWEMPPEYARYMDQIKRYEELTGINLLHTNKRKARNAKEKSKRNFNKYQRMKGSDFEEEKIEMITSFCAEESSEEEQETQNTNDQFKSYSSAMDHSLNMENRRVGQNYSEYDRTNIPKVPLITAVVPTTTAVGPVHGPSLQKDITDGLLLNYNLQHTSEYSSCRHIVTNLIESSNKLRPESPVNQTEKDNNVINMLQKQAQILREKNENKISTIPMDGIEDLIAQIENEKPRDLDQSLNNNKIVNVDKPSISGISLVAGYGGDSDEEEIESDETPNPANQCFPIPLDMIAPDPPIITPLIPNADDISCTVSEVLIENKIVESVPNKYCTEEIIADKSFKRKHRIAFDVLPVAKSATENKNGNGQTTETYSEETESNRIGFGFKNEENSEKPENTKLEPLSIHTKPISFVKSTDLKDADSYAIDNDVEELSTVIEGKLSFLEIGNQPVTPVQLISVQFQTLLTAWKADGLQTDYFRKWLQVTSTELTKLEIGAAPQGWECKWDRENKRYFYRNLSTDETQWDYPNMGEMDGSGDMDISMTPPHNQEDTAMLVESNKAIGKKCADTSPPSAVPNSEDEVTPDTNSSAVSVTLAVSNSSSQNPDSVPINPPLPLTDPSIITTNPPSPPQTLIQTDQPLPPGIESSEIPYYISKNTAKYPAINWLSVPLNNTMGMILPTDPQTLRHYQYMHPHAFPMPTLHPVPVGYGVYSPTSVTQAASATSNDPIVSELESFYTDIAALSKEEKWSTATKVTVGETIPVSTPSLTTASVMTTSTSDSAPLSAPTSASPVPETLEPEKNISKVSSDENSDVAKKKKSTKTKVLPRVGIKNKEVNKMVAKWKAAAQEETEEK